MDKWLKQFIENYEGKSKEAKSIENFLKENYKGNAYVSWATMERLTYMQDPNALFEVVRNDNNSIIWTDSQVMVNEVVQKGEVVNKTTSVMYSHFVRVRLTFLGKVFEEDYPIQDQDYTALKVYNQNAVNKALQRAKAKVASRGTGLGLKLYEGKDLQFDTPEVEEKPEVKKATKKTTKKVEMTDEQKAQNIVDGGVTEAFLNGERTLEPQETKSTNIVVEEPIEVVYTGTTNYNEEVLELKDLIRSVDTVKMNKVLQSLNVAILKQHGFTLNLTDSDVELCDKLSTFTNITVFTKAIKNMLGV